MSDKDAIQAKLGRAGEQIVLNYFSRQGIITEGSIDQYDSQKDMIAGGKKIEVKTQVPFISKDAFSFRQNQLKKCLSVDEVYFVSVPNTQQPHYSEGKVYKIESKKMVHQFYKTKDGRLMVLVPIWQPDMQEVFTMSEEHAKVLQRYSSSGWK